MIVLPEAFRDERRSIHSPQTQSQNLPGLVGRQHETIASESVVGGQNEPFLPSTASCSLIFAKSEPPTKPMATLCLSSPRNLTISGVTLCLKGGVRRVWFKTSRGWSYLGGVRVPSTSKRTNFLMVRPAKSGETMVVVLNGINNDRSILIRCGGARHIHPLTLI